jgi:uncharacterized protein (DUF305 family)
LREVPLCGTTKQSSWIAAACFAHLAMTIILKTRARLQPTNERQPLARDRGPESSSKLIMSLILNRKTRRFFLGTSLALCALVSAPFAAAPAPERDQRRFEINFLESMIDHHFGGVKMAELCAGRTVHAELQAMCDQIKAMQSQEIATMRGWLQSWYGIDHTPELDQKTKRQLEELSALSGAEFEKAFMTMMAMHHAGAARDAVECLTEAYHVEMLNMCAMMLAAQGDEIVQLRLWLRQWYGINDLQHRQRG